MFFFAPFSFRFQWRRQPRGASFDGTRRRRASRNSETVSRSNFFFGKFLLLLLLLLLLGHFRASKKVLALLGAASSFSLFISRLLSFFFGYFPFRGAGKRRRLFFFFGQCPALVRWRQVEKNEKETKKRMKINAGAARKTRRH